MAGAEAIDLTVRIRFRMPIVERIGSKEPSIQFPIQSGHSATLESLGKRDPLDEAEWLVLKVSGKTQDEADSAAELLLDALRLCFAKYYMGADFGRHAGHGSLSKQFRDQWSTAIGMPILYDIHGVMIYPTNPEQKLVRIAGVGGQRSIRAELLKVAVTTAVERGIQLTDRERTAFDLLTAAQTIDQSVHSKFVVLFAAIETLLEPVPCPSAVVEHVDKLIELTTKAGLATAEQKLICDSLRFSKERSIRRKGRELVNKRLPGRNYDGMPVEEFFLACYDIRNDFMHGNHPYPTRDAVVRLIGGLQSLVGDLISFKLNA